MSRALTDLNDAQEQAVTHGTGPLLVLAGAGSGKTRVITRRVAWLISQGADPESILCVTFTNRAAGELRERLAELLGIGVARGVTAGTFHGFGLKILQEHGTLLGLPKRVGIVDAGDQAGLLRRLLRAAGAGRSVEIRDVAGEISRAKRGQIRPGDLRRSGSPAADLAARVYPAYEESLRALGGVDFDDLICLPVRLFEEHPSALEALRARFRWLLVDEFQDTSTIQLSLVSSLAGPGGNLTAVGDDDQAIYGWRGADSRNVREFAQHFPGARILALERNYRSSGAILAAANAVIELAPDRHPKKLWTDAGDGRPVAMVPCRDEDDEAEFVADDMGAAEALGRRWSEFAVLYRTNGQSKAFEEALRRRRIPHRVVGGTRFFDRKEVRDVLAYWKLLVNPHDDLSLRRVINWPTRGIGATSVQALAQAATQAKRSIWSMLRGGSTLSGKAVQGAAALVALVDGLKPMAQADPVGAVRKLHDDLDLRAAVRKDTATASEGVVRWRRIDEMVDSLARHVRPDGGDASRAPGERGDLGGFLDRVILDDRPDSEDEAKSEERVVLSSLHAAKGLEFPFVYLVGVEEGLLPFRRQGVVGDLEEERRLMYVGITRARERLVMTRRRHRTFRGERRPCQPSRFLKQLDGKLVDDPPPAALGVEATEGQGDAGEEAGATPAARLFAAMRAIREEQP